MDKLKNKPHLKSPIPIEFEYDSLPKKFICPSCGKSFTRRDNMLVHQKKSCKVVKELQTRKLINKATRGLLEQNCDLEEKLKSLEQRMINLEEKPSNITVNNQLQVVCVGNNDNYLDMLTEDWGFDRALGFIKDCALSNLTGDCKLIEKIYLDNHESITYLDKNRTKLTYFDEKQNKIVDIRGTQLGKKLANNLQNSYLKGVNYLINQNLMNRACPNRFLEDYDIQAWNQHIYELSDSRYQRKILSQLEIPEH